jgi:hypothetical protein
LLAAGLVCAVSSQVAAQDPAQQPAQPPAQPGQPPASPAPAPAPAAQPPAAQPNPFVFGTDVAILTFLIKADKASDFEAVMAKLHQALAASDKPERKQQAAGWKLYKAKESGPNGAVVYINVFSPALKGADYAPSKIIAEVLPSEAQALYQKLKDAFAGIGRNELTLLEDFSGPATAPAPQQ